MPDVSVRIPPGSDEDTPYPLGNGSGADYALLVRSTAASPANTLTVTLPTGLDLDLRSALRYDDDGDETALRCLRTGQQVTCALGALAARAEIEVDVSFVANADAVPGTSGQFTIGAAPASGTDPTPANNSVQGTVDFLGTAHLRVTVSGDQRRVTVGRTLTVRITVTNDGPQPAPTALGFLGLEQFLDSHFTVTRFTGRQVDAGGGGIGIAARKNPRLAAAQRQYREYRRHAPGDSADADTAPLLFWDAGDLQPGSSVSATMTVRADSAGTDTVFAYAFSDAGDPKCNVDDPDDVGDFTAPPGCDAFDQYSIRAVKAPARRTPPPPSRTDGTTSDRGDGALAATGPHTGTEIEVGLAAVLAGLLLTVAGRRRREQG